MSISSWDRSSFSRTHRILTSLSSPLFTSAPNRREATARDGAEAEEASARELDLDLGQPPPLSPLFSWSGRRGLLATLGDRSRDQNSLPLSRGWAGGLELDRDLVNN